ncbi:hypothetical protein CSV61_12260 [Sporosarcina sp. P3]|uniref:hypothetical protein n=1 Tax=Sporosarcina sp. P3 TaxID=2048245 RepID=UPI000C16F3B6|nr:hypothetical protein [Sporosarcina sp. P3]PID20988.1 hypothetical protein CSV61_12260 [Sporosarcina sp. P3]
MMLSEVGNFKDQLMGLVKFTQYTDYLKAGNLRMSNLKTYIDWEKESGIKGIGDKLEASRVFSDVGIKVFMAETEVLVSEGVAESFNFHVNEDTLLPVYCMYAVDAKVLEITKEDDRFYYTKFSVPDETIKRLVEEFGDKMIFINPAPFIEMVQQTFKKKSYGLKANKVKYDDYSKNNSERLKAYEDKESIDVCFWKDKYFEDQNEYRIIIPNLSIEEPLEVNIGDISDIAVEFKISEFFSEKFELRISK